jgi:hypothetical protein
MTLLRFFGVQFSMHKSNRTSLFGRGSVQRGQIINHGHSVATVSAALTQLRLSLQDETTGGAATLGQFHARGRGAIFESSNRFGNDGNALFHPSSHIVNAGLDLG